MTALNDPRRFRVKVDIDNEAYGVDDVDDPYIYGCYFPSTDCYIFDNGDNNDDVEPHGCEWLDEEPREYLEFEIDMLRKKLDLVIEATGVEIDEEDLFDEEEQIDEEGNHFIIDKTQAPDTE